MKFGLFFKNVKIKTFCIMTFVNVYLNMLIKYANLCVQFKSF